MSRHSLNNSVEEYMYLKVKVMKLLSKQNPKAAIKIDRAAKKAAALITKMKAIETYHRQMGWPHPEAVFEPRAGMNEDLERIKKPTSVGRPILSNPDGTLYSTEMINDASVKAPAKLYKPDGTLFETPVMDGSIISSDLHSPSKIQEYLESKGDSLVEE